MKVLFAALKYKKSFHDETKENLSFLSYIQPKTTNKKEHLRLVISSIRIIAVAKTDES